MNKKLNDFNSILETAKHYRDELSFNCAQTILLSFLPTDELSENTLRNIASPLGAGMKKGLVCGALSASLLVLGYYKVDTAENINKLYSKFEENFGDNYNCAFLLKKATQEKVDRKTHCDNMIYTMLKIVFDILNN